MINRLYNEEATLASCPLTALCAQEAALRVTRMIARIRKRLANLGWSAQCNAAMARTMLNTRSTRKTAPLASAAYSVGATALEKSVISKPVNR